MVSINLSRVSAYVKRGTSYVENAAKKVAVKQNLAEMSERGYIGQKML